MIKKIFFCSLMLVFTFGFAQEITTTVQIGHTQPVNAVSVSDDGDLLASAGKGQSIKVWDLKSNGLVKNINAHNASVMSLEFSKDRKKLLSCDADNVIVISDPVSGEILFRHQLDLELRYLSQAFFSQDEKACWLTSNASDWILLDFETKEHTTFDRGYSAPMSKSSVPPSGYVLHKKDYKSFQLIKEDTLDIEIDKGYTFEFSPNWSQLAISSEKLKSYLVDVKSGKAKELIVNEENRCDGCKTFVAFAGDAKLLTYDNKNGASLWSSSGKKIWTKKYENTYRNIIASPNGEYFVLYKGDEILVGNVKDGKQRLLKQKLNLNFCKPFITNQGILCYPNNDFEIIGLNLTNLKEKFRLKGKLDNELNSGFDYDNWTHDNILKTLAHKNPMMYFTELNYLAIGKVGKEVQVLDLNNGKVKYRLPHESTVFSLASNQNRLFTGDSDGYIKVWDLETGKLITEKKVHSRIVFDLKYQASGDILWSSSWDGFIKSSDPNSLKTLKYISSDNSSSTNIEVLNNGMYVLSDHPVNEPVYIEPDSKKKHIQLSGHTSAITSMNYSVNNRLIATTSSDGSLRVWDYTSGTILNKLKLDYSPALYGAVWKHASVLFGASNNKVIKYNTETNSIDFELIGHESTVTDIAFVLDGKLATRSADGVIKFWDLNEKKELFSFYPYEGDNWLMTKPNGYFNGSSKGMKAIHFSQEGRSVPIESYFNKFYEPNLWEGIWNLETGSNKVELDNESIPNITFLNEVRGDNNQNGVLEAQSQNMTLNIEVLSDIKKIESIRVYNNGKLIENQNLNGDIQFRGAKDIINVDVELISGANNLSVVAVSTEGLTSVPKRIRVSYNGKVAEPVLHVLAIGVNEYKNPSYNLKYALPDSEAFAKSLTKAGNKLFAETNIWWVKDDKATKEFLYEMVEKIKAEINQNDVFVFYFAGHGVYYPGDANLKDEAEYFLMLHEVTNMYDDQKVIAQKNLSSKELMDISKEITAQKQVFILDACQSGGAIEQFKTRGASTEKQLAQLARATGTVFITASQSQEFANEVNDLKHGMFTYAILEKLKSDGKNDKEEISILDLKRYIENRVPELAEQYKTAAQYPTGFAFGNDFIIGLK